MFTGSMPNSILGVFSLLNTYYTVYKNAQVSNTLLFAFEKRVYAVVFCPIAAPEHDTAHYYLLHYKTTANKLQHLHRY